MIHGVTTEGGSMDFWLKRTPDRRQAQKQPPRLDEDLEELFICVDNSELGLGRLSDFFLTATEALDRVRQGQEYNPKLASQILTAAMRTLLGLEQADISALPRFWRIQIQDTIKDYRRLVRLGTDYMTWASDKYGTPAPWVV